MLLTAATSNASATAGVGVCFGTWLTVIVGGTSCGTGNSVPLQRTVAYVIRGS